MQIESYGDWTYMRNREMEFITPGHFYTGWYEIDNKKVYITYAVQISNGLVLSANTDSGLDYIFRCPVKSAEALRPMKS